MRRALLVGRLMLLTGLLAGLPMARSMAAAGSWVASAPAVRVAVPGRQYVSAALSAAEPERLAGQKLVSVRWSYRVAGGRQLQAWLCQEAFCMRVAASGRATPALDAAAPWYFRFELPRGERQAVTVQQLTLIVNYQ